MIVDTSDRERSIKRSLSIGPDPTHLMSRGEQPRLGETVRCAPRSPGRWPTNRDLLTGPPGGR